MSLQRSVHRCIGARPALPKIRAGCRLWELMGRRRHSLLLRISLIPTELALASTSATPVLFPPPRRPHPCPGHRVLTLSAASSGSSRWSRASCRCTAAVGPRSGRDDRFSRPLQVPPFVNLLCMYTSCHCRDSSATMVQLRPCLLLPSCSFPRAIFILIFLFIQGVGGRRVCLGLKIEARLCRGIDCLRSVLQD